MPKTNFTKVEKALEEGLHQIEVTHLLDVADDAAGKERKTTLPSQDQRKAILQSLESEIKKLHKQDRTVYKKIGFVKMDIKKLIDNPEALTPEDWKKVRIIKEKLEAYKKELSQKLPKSSDEEIVTKKRKEQINARYNVRKTWLPLK